MLLSPYARFADKVRLVLVLAWCALVMAFLVLPIFVPVPLSVNAESFFTYPLKGFSWRWYKEVLGSGAWRDAIWHSIVIAAGVTILATSLGTLAAVGLSNPRIPARRIIMSVLVSPLIVPVIITAVGAYLFYAPIGLANSFSGIIIAQTTIASPFVVVTVGASLANFDRTLMRAAAICGAQPHVAFKRVMLPLILPGVLSGAAFAFVASFDELVIALFLAGPEQRTLPMQMFVGLREHLDPTITAAATLMMSLSILLLVAADRLRRRGSLRRGGAF
jgi:putative spermidine/putrescine transport system permease protein